MIDVLRPAGDATTARINDQTVAVAPHETLLQAALRAGVDFPNSCRVGGCGACKCKLTEGSVRELTETGYLLSGEELDEGYILACQSTPRGPVRIEVELPEAVGGRVVAQERLTHDITRLHIQLERALAHRAGQFVSVELEGLPDVRRSYSFATPSRPDGTVQFIIRHVPGGAMSGAVHTEDLVGRAVTLTGPGGDFWLREDAAPALFVAGGSGLAPILAMLRAGVEAGDRRPVTVLFGARAERDLYALDELAELAGRWRGRCTIVPVLSAAADETSWTGARGLVTEHISAHLDRDSRAYLCGPPGMVDAAAAVLLAGGVRSEHIHFDRFTTQADAAGSVAREPARVWDYAKFGLFHLVGLMVLAFLVAGGPWITVGMVTIICLYVFGDALGGDDTRTPHYAHTGILTAMLWSALPLVALLSFVAVWGVCAGDPLGFGALVEGVSGYDALAARAATSPIHHVSGVVLMGLLIGLTATVPAHELMHRTWDRASVFISRLLMAFTLDTNFSIEHVYGHHAYVSTTEDPATAPRGRNVYAHVLISTFRGNVSSWNIEKARLQRKRLPLLSHHNVVIRGHLMSAGLVALAGAMGGLTAAAYFVACALAGKALLEVVNYMEHYGMVRNPDLPVQPRHSWNTNKRLSSWTMFYLTRHSHHHAQGEVPYQDLRPYPEAPMMIGGYLTTMIVALVPSLWHRLMTPKVLEWDAKYASPEEQRMAAEANARSGVAALEAQVPAAGRGLVAVFGK